MLYVKDLGPDLWHQKHLLPGHSLLLSLIPNSPPVSKTSEVQLCRFSWIGPIFSFPSVWVQTTLHYCSRWLSHLLTSGPLQLHCTLSWLPGSLFLQQESDPITSLLRIIYCFFIAPSWNHRLPRMAVQWGNSVDKRGWIIQPEGKRKNDMVRPSFGEQGPHFIFQSSFYTLSYA